jgi:hypothetical protein
MADEGLGTPADAADTEQMPRYRSPYDSNPLPDPGNGSPDTSAPPDIAPSRTLQVNWSGPQPLHTVTPAANNGGAGGGGLDDGGTGGPGQPDQPNQLIPKIPTMGQMHQQKLQAGGPEWETVHVRPEDLLAHEQSVLDRAKSLANRFNALVSEAESVLGAEFWGTEEGVNQTSHAGVGGRDRTQADNAGGFQNSPHYTYTPSALSTREFLEALRMNQRGALQHAADAITMSGGFIELLNSTADLYASADQYSVFPNKATISKGQTS